MENDECRVLLLDFAKIRVCWKKDFMLKQHCRNWNKTEAKRWEENMTTQN
jgi:hypothetical protein